MLSVRCVPSGGFRQVFSAKCLPSNVRHFLEGGVFRIICNKICLKPTQIRRPLTRDEGELGVLGYFGRTYVSGILNPDTLNPK